MIRPCVHFANCDFFVNAVIGVFSSSLRDILVHKGTRLLSTLGSILQKYFGFDLGLTEHYDV